MVAVGALRGYTKSILYLVIVSDLEGRGGKEFEEEFDSSDLKVVQELWRFKGLKKRRRTIGCKGHGCWRGTNEKKPEEEIKSYIKQYSLLS
ncbi:hypothetical protein VNO77_05080 [Canavalia gladiata]|uniref:Uncharacterized protein n=1 Tax=Canavalia gladiata TaxID=3824 RepID=A0AAN9MXQ9_CANGL